MSSYLCASHLIDELVYSLKQMAKEGVLGFDCSPEALELVEKWAVPSNVSSTNTRETLSDIRQNLGECRRCPLAQVRQHIVYGSGNPKAELIFVGTEPEYEDDISGEPFSGEQGKLLFRIIAAMKLTPDDVYLCHLVKCRPSNNRNPLKMELGACLPFLKRQIAAIDPSVICTLGGPATQVLLKKEQPISKLRGRFYDYRGIKVMPTFDPAELLRHPEKKRETWQDIQKIMQELKIQL